MLATETHLGKVWEMSWSKLNMTNENTDFYYKTGWKPERAMSNSF